MPAPPLDHVDHELIVMIAIHQACTGMLDGIVLTCLEIAQRVIGFRGSGLDQCQAFHQTREVGQRHAGQMEVVECTLGLDTVIGLCRDRLASQ